MHTLLGFSRNKYKRATDRYTVDVHVRATCSTPKCHGASGFTLLKNPPSILTFARCYGAVKHLFVRRFLCPVELAAMRNIAASTHRNKRPPNSPLVTCV